MYNSKYYTCEQIDQRLLEGYYDDAVAAGYTGSKAQYLAGLLKAINYSANPTLTADKVVYNPAISGLTHKNVQGAIDELANKKADKEETNRLLAEKANTADVNSKFTEEKNRVNTELANKFDKASVAQESGDAEDKVMSQKATTDAIQTEIDRANAAEQAIIFDVSVYNNGAVFESLQALLSSSNLNTIFPTSARRGGMAIRFIQGSEQSSDNKYVQYRLMNQNFSTIVTDWQGVDDKPTVGSNNLVKSGGVYNKFSDLNKIIGIGKNINEQKATSISKTNDYQLDFNKGAISVPNGFVNTYNVQEGESYHIFGTFYTTSAIGAAIIVIANSGTVGNYTKSRNIESVYSKGSVLINKTIKIQNGETKLFVSSYEGNEVTVNRIIETQNEGEVLFSLEKENQANGSISIKGKNNNGTTKSEIVIPVASTEQSGLISAEDKDNLDNLINDIYDSEGDYVEMTPIRITENYQLDFNRGAISVSNGSVKTYSIQSGKKYKVVGTCYTPKGCSIVITSDSTNVGNHTVIRNLYTEYTGGEYSVNIEFTAQSTENWLMISSYEGYELNAYEQGANIEGIKTEVEKIVGEKISYIDAYSTSGTDIEGKEYYGFDNNNYSSIRRAINYAKTKANKYDKYVIRCHGHFIADTVAKFIKDKSYNNFISLYNTDYISLCGEGKDRTLIEGRLPNNLNIDYSTYQVLQSEGNHCSIKGMTIKLTNGRYPIHTDQSYNGGCNDYIQEYDNCRIWHNGNTGNAVSSWKSFHAIGFGICSGQKITFNNCDLITQADPIYMHTHSNNQNYNPFKLEFNNTKLIDTAIGDSNIIVLQGLFCPSEGEVILNGTCGNGLITMSSSLYHDNYSKFTDIIQDIKICGHSNGYLGFNGISLNSQLKFTVIDTTRSHTLRIDTTCTAFDTIIAGKDKLDFTTPLKYVFVDGYMYKDGIVGDNALVYGLKHNPSSYGTSSKKIDQTLGKHLGNCTETSKTLTLIFDGSEINIVFTNDYTSMSNDDVIAEINNFLNNYGIVASMSSASDWYYPEIDNVVWCSNTSGTVIRKGNVVSHGTYQEIINCTSGMIHYGIALDTIPNYGIGRILTKGIISTDSNDKFWVNGNAFVPNTRYRVSDDGILVEDSEGSFLCVRNYRGTKKYILF